MNDNRSSADLFRRLDFLAVMIASGFFVSFLPSKLVVAYRLRFGRKSFADRKWTGAGLVGSLWGAATYLVMPTSISCAWPVVLMGVLISIGISHVAEKALQNHDDSRIVIDEWIGTWIALVGLAPVISPLFVLAVILFRFFDVFKGPWGHALQKWPGGLGVVMDDVVAGILANIFIRFFVFLG